MHLKQYQNVRIEGQDASGAAVRIEGIVIDPKERELVIRFPRVRTLSTAFVTGGAVVLEIADESGLHRADTRIRTLVVTPAVTMSVTRPSSFDTYQKRSNFRCVVKLPLTFTVAQSQNLDFVGLAEQRAHIRDISAGGMSMDASLRLFIGDRISATILPTEYAGIMKPVDIAGQILRIEKAARAKLSTHAVAFAFESKREQEDMVRLMFDLQRTLRAK